MIDHPTRDAGFAVYVHWPFCLSKCPYCDFNSHVRREPVDEDRFAAAFAREIAAWGQRTPGRAVGSIFLGGGTPSLMRPDTVGRILDAIGATWPILPDAEVTLEANPTSVEAERFRGYRAAGVNRASLGVQALDDGDLKRLGRLHSADEAMRAVAVATSVFERVSFDLIYARPGQTPAAWRAELGEAIRRAAEHLSLYQLTIEPGTWFERLHKNGSLVVPDNDTARALFDVTREVCEAAGLPAYEVSNHARPGAESRHNLVYWRYGEYVGIGPGAHGRIVTPQGRLATSTERSPEAWLDLVERTGTGLIEDIPLTREETATSSC
jgi:oxygen-independent coproporphyrinogen-3 oxidase